MEVIPYHLLSNWLSKARSPSFPPRALSAIWEAARASVSSTGGEPRLRWVGKRLEHRLELGPRKLGEQLGKAVGRQQGGGGERSVAVPCGPAFANAFPGRGKAGGKCWH